MADEAIAKVFVLFLLHILVDFLKFCKVNGCVIGNSNLVVFVGPFISKKERQQQVTELQGVSIFDSNISLSQSAQNFTNVYVKDLNTSANEPEVFALFSKYGKVTSGVIMKNDNGASKGFGFFNYETHEQAQAAVEALNNFEFLGKRIYVARAQKLSERRRELEQTYKSYLMDHLRKGTNLYVKNLDDDVTDSMLQG